MHRIDSPGATIDNLFTEGNPSLGIPATEVSDDWLNDVQEEISNLIENQGITLVKGQQDQLEAAIALLVSGGIGGGGINIKIDPLLNATADQEITGLVFDKLITKAVTVNFDIHRETDSSNVQETGMLAITHDSKDDVWRVALMMSSFDDAGATFAITVDGQVEITTDNLAGASYEGQIRINSITKLAL